MNQFWECEQGHEAIQKIRGIGHLVFPFRKENEHTTSFVGIALDGGKNWRHPSANYSDVQVFSLADLLSFAEFGATGFHAIMRHREALERSRSHRIFWRDGSEEVVASLDAFGYFVPSRKRLLARLEEDGVQAERIEVFNPFTNLVIEVLRPIYGFAYLRAPEWHGYHSIDENAKRKIVVLRPADESPPKLPSAWRLLSSPFRKKGNSDG